MKINYDVEKILVQQAVSATINLDNRYDYSVLLDFYLTIGNEFYLEINFRNINLQDIEILNLLCKKPVININSQYFIENNYDIKQIAVYIMELTEPMAKWKCFTNPKGEFWDIK
ncbi:hypothetical protein [Chryseobacterium indoltheticum]|uniref:Uncharacterized protein n=1 Tax=Chryseobacterium indoltheticum TaxID=254 RepID=A0A3G6MXW3_9FLAO|nr:hypothetical protein [Chryseobacterium indoltheticum]AZA60087.1 hypothetical protein EG340_03100 [Chryseobacterium indoltheticum]